MKCSRPFAFRLSCATGRTSAGPSQFVADRIPSARAVEFPGIGYFASAPPEVFDEIERFLSGRLVEREPDRVLLTLLFTDIVGSTELAARLGDRDWRACARSMTRQYAVSSSSFAATR